MSQLKRILFLMICLFLAACQGEHGTTKEIDMYNADGDMVGTAKFNEQPDGVQITVKVEGLSPGFHGIHVHEFPTCEGPDFQSAGNHLNPEGKEHGLMHPDGAHLGDLPNVEADSSGHVDAEIMLADATLLEGKKSILRGEGTSLIITEDKDDGISQPSGDSGIRLICGELKSQTKRDHENEPTDPTETEKENGEDEGS